MTIDQASIKDILLSESYVSPDDMDRAEAVAKHEGKALVDVLIDQGSMTRNLLGQALGEHLGFPFIDISRQNIDDEIFFAIPELVAKEHRVIGLSRSGDGIKLAMADPQDVGLMAHIEKRYGARVIPYFALPEDIDTALKRYRSNIKDAFEAIVAQLKADGPKETKDDVITKIVDLLIQYGEENRASDIHIEPYRTRVTVRFRIDGVLHDVLEIERVLFEPVLSRIKILSRMRTDEHRAAQDGKFRFTYGKTNIDIRVSIVPTNTGENVVMRLLSASSRQFDLSSLGMRDQDLHKTLAAAKHPHGMILVTGPTGSGKTTTLYAVLKILDHREVHIATIEDPVEYDIEGVTQIQVNTKTNLTFASGLRALVRQDPDIIMVGEIRDEETAGIAVNSALTGHLVLSTLHTNDAATALPRFLDMNIEPFLVASTVNIVIAQRLVRTICSTCRVSYTPEEKERGMLEKDQQMKAYVESIATQPLSQLRLYKGAGCKVCGDTGYEGRIGIFEILIMSDTMRELIMKHATAAEIKDQAQKEGMTTMMQDGIAKVLQGVTTLEEVLRVARD